MLNRSFLPGNSEKIDYKNGHWIVSIKVMNSINSQEANIRFVYDTGSTINIISREHFEDLKIEESGIKTTNHETKTYSNEVAGKIWVLPFLFIGGFTVKNSYCFTPNDPKRTQNLLGIKTLAKFDTLIEPVNSRIYFDKNSGNLPNYPMLCGEIFITRQP
ncbi:MAG: aspartyl protease family protein [Firmicutes bacterium]|nr:aspartyl protease family protein [Bacillota bacterium]